MWVKKLFFSWFICFLWRHSCSFPFFSSKFCGTSLIKENAQSRRYASYDVEVNEQQQVSIVAMPFEDLKSRINGSGKAKIIWNNLRKGVDPLSIECADLSEKAKSQLLDITNGNSLLSATIEDEIVSICGTRKLLLKLQDKLRIESVLIPSYKFERTTLCISTQIGFTIDILNFFNLHYALNFYSCDRGCAFCLTGKMGLIRNLTASEMITQVIIGMNVSRRNNMPPLTNVVRVHFFFLILFLQL